MSLYEIVKALQEAKGSNAKKEILEQHCANQELRRYLRLVFEPTISYYVTETPQINSGSQSSNSLLEALNDGEHFDLTKAEELARQLNERELSGSRAKQAISNLHFSLTKEGQELLFWMINRNIQAGIGIKTINGKIAGMLTEVPYQRCTLPKDSNIKNWDFNKPGFFVFSQLKEDGQYGNNNVSNGKVELTSREGNTMPECTSFAHLKADSALFEEQYGYPIQLQGELLMRYKGEMMPRAKGNGMFNSILQTGIDPGPDYEVVMRVWDCIPLKEATTKNAYNVRYEDRWSQLEAAVDALKGQIKCIELVESRKCFTFKDMVYHLREVMKRKSGENKLEGTIWKAHDAVWLDGDNKDQIKGKCEFVVDLRIIGFKDADKTSKNASMFGSIEFESEDGILEVSVTGITDKLRKELHENRDYYIGGIASVRANDITFSEDLSKTKHSLFLPRWENFRKDKKEADSFARVVEQMESARENLSFIEN